MKVWMLLLLPPAMAQLGIVSAVLESVDPVVSSAVPLTSTIDSLSDFVVFAAPSSSPAVSLESPSSIPSPSLELSPSPSPDPSPSPSSEISPSPSPEVSSPTPAVSPSPSPVPSPSPFVPVSPSPDPESPSPSPALSVLPPTSVATQPSNGDSGEPRRDPSGIDTVVPTNPLPFQTNNDQQPPSDTSIPFIEIFDLTTLPFNRAQATGLSVSPKGFILDHPNVQGNLGDGSDIQQIPSGNAGISFPGSGSDGKTSNSGNQPGGSNAVVIGVSVAGVIALVVVGAVAGLIYRRKSTSKDPEKARPLSTVQSTWPKSSTNINSEPPRLAPIEPVDYADMTLGKKSPSLVSRTGKTPPQSPIYADFNMPPLPITSWEKMMAPATNTPQHAQYNVANNAHSPEEKLHPIVLDAINRDSLMSDGRPLTTFNDVHVYNPENEPPLTPVSMQAAGVVAAARAVAGFPADGPQSRDTYMTFASTEYQYSEAGDRQTRSDYDSRRDTQYTDDRRDTFVTTATFEEDSSDESDYTESRRDTYATSYTETTVNRDTVLTRETSDSARYTTPLSYRETVSSEVSYADSRETILTESSFASDLDHRRDTQFTQYTDYTSISDLTSEASSDSRRDTMRTDILDDEDEDVQFAPLPPFQPLPQVPQISKPFTAPLKPSPLRTNMYMADDLSSVSSGSLQRSIDSASLQRSIHAYDADDDDDRMLATRRA